MAVESNDAVADKNQTIITLKVGDTEIGKLNPDKPAGTQVPAGKEFYLTAEELNKINFEANSQKDITAIEWKVNGNDNTTPLNPSTNLPTKNTAWPITPPQSFSDNKITLQFTLAFDDSTSESFTFKLHDLPKIQSVKVQAANGQDAQVIPADSPISLKGPSETLEILVEGISANAKVYTLNLEFDGIKIPEKTPFTNDPSARIDSYKFEMNSAGVYAVTLTEKGKSQPYETRQFTITPGDLQKPKITRLLDTSSEPSIQYDINQQISSTVPVYRLRNKKCKLIIPALADTKRSIRVKYRALNELSGTPKSEFEPINQSGSTNTYELPATLSPGIYEIQAEDSWNSALNPPSELDRLQLANVDRIRIVIPNLLDSNLLQPNITAFKNHLYPKNADPTFIQTPSVEVKVFGEYLQIWGVNGYPDTEPEFLLYNYIDSAQGSPITPAPAGDITITKNNPVMDPNGKWNVKLHFKKANNNTKRVLYVRNVHGGQHAYSSNSVTIKTQSSPFIAQAPELDKFQLIVEKKNPQNLVDNIILDEKSTQLAIKCTDSTQNENLQFLVFTEKNNQPVAAADYNSTAKFTETLTNGQHRIYLKYAQGDQISEKRSPAFTLNIQTNGLEVTKVEPPNFGTAPGVQQLKVTFSAGNPLNIKTIDNSERVTWFKLIPSKGSGLFLFNNGIAPKTVDFVENENAVVLTFEGLPADIYQLQIVGSSVSDIFGNLLQGTKGQPGTNYLFTLSKPEPVSKDSESGSGTVGVSDFVKYHDYEKREPPTPGFNPSDKVVTRVARLYYYRDAHRVAQILNSEVKSLNQKGYNEAQITADRARTTYEQTVKKRRIQEKKTVQAAKDLRAVESDYRTQQQILSGLVRERAQLKDDGSNVSDKKDKLENAITAAQGQITSLRSEITKLSGLMNEEDAKLQELTIDEENQSAELFRRELKAEKTDLYTIGNGVPESYDAVQQVTIKVIGEGLIHLRGPIKGVNIIRTMINQIDSPVGQVRIAMHTIQINGEDGKRMEIVADRIQKSIDQSRFLTVQSAQMLRKAIVSVAAEVANSTCPNGIAMSQEERDLKYLHAFFGQDFIEALQAMDSEFLQSGNKLLSIHSMDTTSLSSALFVLALAKNEIRQQILAQFYASIETELPEAECQFLFQGGPTKATKHKHKLNLLSPYAHFQSFKGFFDHEVVGTDTMTPIQREFLRLAQIFKAKLTTEREYNLHIMERAVIEQRDGDYTEDLEKARAAEKVAEQKLKSVQESIQNSQLDVIKASTGLQTSIDLISTDYQNFSTEFNSFQKVFDSIINAVLKAGIPEPKIDISTLSPEQRKKFLEEMFPLKPNSGPFEFNKRTLALLERHFHIFQNINEYINNNIAKNINEYINNNIANNRDLYFDKEFKKEDAEKLDEYFKTIDTQLATQMDNLSKKTQREIPKDLKKAQEEITKMIQKNPNINPLSDTITLSRGLASNAYKSQFIIRVFKIINASGSFKYGNTTFKFKLIPKKK